MRFAVFLGKAQLPNYDEAPAYIAPACCRLYMGLCWEPEEPKGPAHRRAVLERVMAEGPVAVDAHLRVLVQSPESELVESAMCLWAVLRHMVVAKGGSGAT